MTSLLRYRWFLFLFIKPVAIYLLILITAIFPEIFMYYQPQSFNWYRAGWITLYYIRNCFEENHVYRAIHFIPRIIPQLVSSLVFSKEKQIISELHKTRIVIFTGYIEAFLHDFILGKFINLHIHYPVNFFYYSIFSLLLTNIKYRIHKCGVYSKWE